MMLTPIQYDKKGNPVVVKSYMETTHKRWIEQGKIADEAIPFKAKYTELERFNALHAILLLTNLDCIKLWGNLNQIFYLSFLDRQLNG